MHKVAWLRRRSGGEPALRRRGAPAGAGPAFKKKKGSSKGLRSTRQALAERRGPKPLSTLLDEANLGAVDPKIPTYLRAEMGPPKTASARKFCSVCGAPRWHLLSPATAACSAAARA